MEGGRSRSTALSDDSRDAVELQITDQIDLHAFRPQDIVSVAEAYLDACMEKGLREVRLIHGRGRGVQRAAVQRMLRQRPDVVDFRDASPLSGGWGATLVRLSAPSRAPGRE